MKERDRMDMGTPFLDSPCSRDAKSSERSARAALRSEDFASRLHGHLTARYLSIF